MKIKPDIKIKEIAGERVAIMQGTADVDMTKVVSFNPTAEWLWNKLIGSDFSEDDVVQLIIDNFNLDAATATADAQRWIAQCVDAAIIDN
jgi:hypothetical protein